MSEENQPLAPTSVGVLGGGTTDVIFAQFYRTNPTKLENIHIIVPSPDPADRQLLPPNTFNHTFASDGATFPNGNSVKFNHAGSYVHTVTIYGLSDVNGIVAVDLINDAGLSYNPSSFSVKNISTASTDPLILTTVLTHEVDQTARIRIGAAADAPYALDYSIWSITWSIKK